MSIRKTLLFPFSANSPYFEGYAWAIELAIQLNARLQLFTTIPSDDDASAENVYQSLLAAHGYYLHHFKHSITRKSQILREQYIVTGNFREELIKHLNHNPVDIMIIDAAFQSEHDGFLKDVVRESNAAIILSSQVVRVGDGSAPVITDHFYNQLRNAEFYKVPANFFSSLGQDHALFNYLRRFFQKSPH